MKVITEASFKINKSFLKLFFLIKSVLVKRNINREI